MKYNLGTELTEQQQNALHGISGAVGAIQAKYFGSDLGQENISLVANEILNGKYTVAGYDDKIHGIMGQIGALQAKYNNKTSSVNTVAKDIFGGYLTIAGYEDYLKSAQPPAQPVIIRPQRTYLPSSSDIAKQKINELLAKYNVSATGAEILSWADRVAGGQTSINAVENEIISRIPRTDEKKPLPVGWIMAGVATALAVFLG
jgi:uncharacterized membrane protein